MTDRLQLQVVLDAVERVTGPLRRIMDTSSEAGTTIKALREKLRGLQDQQQAVASFRALKDKLGQDAQALHEARQKAGALSAELAAQQKRIQPLQAAYDTSSGRVERLAIAHGELANRLKSTRAEQLATSAAHEKTAAQIRDLQAQLVALPAGGNSKAITQEITTLQAAQRGQLAEVRRLEDASKLLRKEHQAGGAALKSARAETRGHESALRAALVPVTKLQKEMAAATSVAGRLKAAHAAGGQELQRLRAKLAEAGIKTGDLSRHERELRGSIVQANAALDQQKQKLAEVAKQHGQMVAARDRLTKSQQMAGGLAAAGAGAAGVAYAASRPLGAVTRAFMPAENASTQLRGSMMGADGRVAAEFKEIDALAKRLGDRLPGTTAQFTEMMTMLRRQGLSAKSILGGTGEAAAYLAVQLQMPSVEAAEFAAKMQDATRTTEKDMMGLMDTIQRTFYLGVDPQNMLAGFNKLSPAMRLIRKEGVEGANALAPFLVMMDQTGMAGESAGNAIRKVFQSGVDLKKFGDANDLLKDFKSGFQLDFTDGKGNFGSIENLFTQLTKLKQLNDTQRQAVMKKMFGDDAETIQVVETLMAKGVSGYQEVASKMRAQADLRGRVNEQLKTLGNVTEAAEGSFTNALSEIGVAIAPQLKTMIQWLGERSVAFGDWVRDNPKLAATIFWVTAAVAGIAAVVAGFALTLAAVLGPMALVRFALTAMGIKAGVLGIVLKGIGSGALRALGGLRMIGQVLLYVGRLALMNPIGLVVTGIALAALLIIKYWGPIKDLFGGFWDFILDITSSLPAKFSALGTEIVSGLINGITGAAKGLWGAVTGLAEGVKNHFKVQLGIKSPSRVFAALGDDTMAGLKIGLERSGEGPFVAVRQVAQKVTRAGALPALGVMASSLALPVAAQQPVIDRRPPIAASAPARPAPQITVEGDTIHLTLQAAPGTDPRQMQQMIERVLDERDRRKAARLRTALADRE